MVAAKEIDAICVCVWERATVRKTLPRQNESVGFGKRLLISLSAIPSNVQCNK